MKKLIVNADDFGLHQAINDGIIKGHKDGFITSTSLMCGADAFDDAVSQAKQYPNLGVGIHLTLVGGGKPLVPARQLRTLVDESGRLPADYTVFAKRWYASKIKKKEVIEELQAQMERGLNCGLTITHIDSHQHLHVLPGVTDIVLQLCSDFGVKKIRMPQEGWFWRGGFNSSAGRFIGREGLSFCSALAKRKAQQAKLSYPQHFFGMLAGGNLNDFLVGEIIKNIPEGVSEIMTHPGMDAEILEKSFAWKYHWEDELQAFLSEKNKRLLEQQQVTLINFGGL
ncbi:ChbG/HpnK family deacetylase [uncultured Phascolarctobacterium sp.]|uniref:ChbG/HpnK family deacetylase n=1 Tax=uncultured Phascolarctobacterium sp. TaxID=512296 RepID=UPI0027D9AE28|nr:ChbG/HpnK family deacetylase [uncultured Phascolarctobacterium sp.]